MTVHNKKSARVARKLKAEEASKSKKKTKAKEVKAKE